jgi:hypothetical protein
MASNFLPAREIVRVSLHKNKRYIPSQLLKYEINRVFSLSFTLAMYKLSKSCENVSFPASSKVI